MTGEAIKGEAVIPPHPSATGSGTLGESAPPVAIERDASTQSPDFEAESAKAAQLTSFADFHHQYVGQYIQLADAKAGASFALTSGVTAFLLNSSTFAHALRFGEHWAVNGLAVLALALLIASSLLSFLVIVPRLPKGGDSLIFWKTVASLPTASDYVRRVASLTGGSLASERVSHSYNLSVVCNRKYVLLRRAMLLAGAALFSTFLYWLAAA